jgi:hypothetical protein
MCDIKQLFRDIKRYIHNIIKWSPILWRDRDYDYWYILDSLQFKIKNTSKYIAKHKHYAGYKRDVERMNLCVRLLDKIQNNFYKFEYQDFCTNKVTILHDVETECELVKEISSSEHLNEYFNKYKREYKKIFDKEKTPVWNAVLLGNSIENKARRILFKIIEENIFNWWD